MALSNIIKQQLHRSAIKLLNQTNQDKTPEEVWAKWDGVTGLSATDRKARAIGGNLTSLSIDREHAAGEYRGSDRAKYYTTLTRCSCPDFTKQSVPCKHMYHLAYQLGLDIHLDYMEIMNGALDNPGYDDVPEYRMKDFWAYRNTFEKMLGEKVMDLISQNDGRISQTDLKDRLSEGEMKFYDYTMGMLENDGRIKREKEKGRVVFYKA